MAIDFRSVSVTVEDGWARCRVAVSCPECGAQLPPWGPIAKDDLGSQWSLSATVHGPCGECGETRDWTCKMWRKSERWNAEVALEEA